MTRLQAVLWLLFALCVLLYGLNSLHSILCVCPCMMYVDSVSECMNVLAKWCGVGVSK